MNNLLLILVICRSSVGFLLETIPLSTGNTAGSTGVLPGVTGDDKYYNLLQKVQQVLQQQKQTEKLILSLQQDLALCQENYTSVQNISDVLLQYYNLLRTDFNPRKSDFSRLENSYSELKRDDGLKVKVIELETENTQLDLNNSHLEDRLDNLTIKINKFEQDIASFSLSTSSSVTSLEQNINALNFELTTLTSNISSLGNSFSSHRQDYLALLNQTNITQKKVSVLEGETTALGVQLLTEIHELNKNLSSEIQDVTSQIQLRNETVALTSCVSNPANYTSGDVFKFPVIKTSYGIPDLADFQKTGKFKCTVPGIYLFSAFIMSSSQYASFEMRKNNDYQYIYIGGEPNGFRDYHTGSGTIVKHLDVGDTLYVDGLNQIRVPISYSCITIIKIT